LSTTEVVRIAPPNDEINAEERSIWKAYPTPSAVCTY
jgi:hypothetical protein